VLENENVSIVFCSCCCQKWVDLSKTKTKTISDPRPILHIVN